MPYATLADVKGEMPNFPLNATSRPNDDKAQEFLDELHVELNAVLKALGYVLPIAQADSPLAFSILKMMVTQGAIARILRARNFGVDSPESNGSRDAQARYSDLIKRLTDPNDPFSLPDVPGSPVYTKFHQAVVESHVAGLDLDPDDEPAVTRDMVF